MPLFRLLTVAVTLTLTAANFSGCTCNKAGTSRQARPKTSKLARGKVHKAKMGKRMKGRRGNPNVAKVPAKLYFVDQKKLDAGADDPFVEVIRQVGAKSPAKNAVWNLFKGPTEDEKAKGLVFLGSGSVGFQGFSIEGDTATLQLRGGCNSNGGTVTVYDLLSRTLEAFPEIEHVRVVGPDESVPTEPGDHRPACLEP